MAEQSVTPLGTVDDMATRMRVRRGRAYDLVREGRVPGVVRIGRQIRIDMEALEDWISAGGDADAVISDSA